MTPVRGDPPRFGRSADFAAVFAASRYRTAVAVGVVWTTQVLLLGLYYPKWRYGGPEAITSWDVLGYYMYLPATFIYGDLAGESYHEEVTALTRPSSYWDHSFRHEPSGAQVMKYSVGQALQFAPFFALGHAYASASEAYAADGFSRPYQVALAAEILFIALLGLLLLRWLLLRYFPDDVAAWAIIGVGLGTNYLEYSSLTGGLTHNNLFAMYAALALASGTFYRRPSFATAALIGGIVGLATLTRPTELLMALLPLVWGITPSVGGLRERAKLLGEHGPKLALAAAVGGLVVAIQPVYWYWAAGEWVVYSYRDQGFSFLSPHIWRGLVSARAGWIPYTPMAVLLVGGLVALWRDERARTLRLAPGIALYVAVFAYVAWSWDIWWYGGSLGQRTMVQVYPLLAIGLAGGISAARSCSVLRRGTFAAAFAGCILVNLFWTHQAHRGGNLRVGEMTWRYYFATIGRFDRDRDREKLLDRSRLYRGPLLDSNLVARIGYEDVDSTLTCPGAALSGERSLCIREGTEYTPRVTVALPGADGEDRWLRASATIDVRSKTWDSWAMAQFIVRFMRVTAAGEVEQVDALMIRPERLVDGGRASVYLDGPVPAGPIDSVAVEWWKPGLGGEVLVDEVELVTYRPE